MTALELLKYLQRFPEEELDKYVITDDNNHLLQVDRDSTDGVIYFEQYNPNKVHIPWYLKS